MEPYRDAIDRKEAAERARAMAAEALRILRRRALRSAAGAAAALGLLSLGVMSFCIITARGNLLKIASPGETGAAFAAAQVALPCAVAWVTLRLKARKDERASRWLAEEAGLSGVPWRSILEVIRLARGSRADGLKPLAVALLYAPPLAWAMNFPGGGALFFLIVLAWGWVPFLFLATSARPLFRDPDGAKLGVALVGPLIVAGLFSPLILAAFGLRRGAGIVAAGVALPFVLRAIFARILAAEDRALDALEAVAAAGEAEEGRGPPDQG